ncbi:MAG: tRNA (adenosine(37)-N6)-dimethylallyltransferase MiaA [Deltaproteobacteria bacterium]|nr:tRNA (adenosine(37)-N6)-dimethylallyltransferase MiaA [Deltaproteobacteria bacterium]
MDKEITSSPRTCPAPISVVVITGPTATGKTTLAIELARRFEGEIISADSMQVYRLMDIGTAKPTAAERNLVPHHLIDVAWPDESFDAAAFRLLAGDAATQISSRGKRVFVAGGTGLYIKVLLGGLIGGTGPDPAFRAAMREKAATEGPEAIYAELAATDPKAATEIHPHDTFRVIRALEIINITRSPASQLRSAHAFQEQRFVPLILALDVDRPELYRRVEDRVETMLQAGWIEEVQELLHRGYDPMLKPLQSIGYKQLVDFLLDRHSLDQAKELIKRDTRRYVKRQLTWFRRDARINWRRPEQLDTIVSEVSTFLDQRLLR